MDYLVLIDNNWHFNPVCFSAKSFEEAVRFANDTFCFDNQTVVGVWSYTDYIKSAFVDNEHLSAWLSAMFVSNLAYTKKSKKNGKSR